MEYIFGASFQAFPKPQAENFRKLGFSGPQLFRGCPKSAGSTIFPFEKGLKTVAERSRSARFETFWTAPKGYAKNREFVAIRTRRTATKSLIINGTEGKEAPSPRP